MRVAPALRDSCLPFRGDRKCRQRWIAARIADASNRSSSSPPPSSGLSSRSPSVPPGRARQDERSPEQQRARGVGVEICARDHRQARGEFERSTFVAEPVGVGHPMPIAVPTPQKSESWRRPGFATYCRHPFPPRESYYSLDQWQWSVGRAEVGTYRGPRPTGSKGAVGRRFVFENTIPSASARQGVCV